MRFAGVSVVLTYLMVCCERRCSSRSFLNCKVDQQRDQHELLVLLVLPHQEYNHNLLSMEIAFGDGLVAVWSIPEADHMTAQGIA